MHSAPVQLEVCEHLTFPGHSLDRSHASTQRSWPCSGLHARLSHVPPPRFRHGGGELVIERPTADERKRARHQSDPRSHVTPPSTSPLSCLTRSSKPLSPLPGGNGPITRPESEFGQDPNHDWSRVCLNPRTSSTRARWTASARSSPPRPRPRKRRPTASTGPSAPREKRGRRSTAPQGSGREWGAQRGRDSPA